MEEVRTEDTEKNFSEMLYEFMEAKEFAELVPDFDEHSLMVHWTNYD